MIALALIAVVYLMMAGEAVVSARNERILRGRGAVAPAGDERIYKKMRWAYPGTFALAATEGLVRGRPGADALLAGLVLFAMAKTLKLWAMISLGTRWTYKLLVVPGAPLVTRGPYRFFRHPNYLAVVGEIVSVALALAAPVTGAIARAGFGWLMWRRIVIEERALGIR